jgi:hypothetical protein
MKQGADGNRNRGQYNVLVPLNGVMVTVAEWSDATGLPRHIVYERLKRGWSPERAVSVPRDATRGDWMRGRPKDPAHFAARSAAQKQRWTNRKEQP